MDQHHGRPPLNPELRYKGSNLMKPESVTMLDDISHCAGWLLLFFSSLFSARVFVFFLSYFGNAAQERIACFPQRFPSPPVHVFYVKHLSCPIHSAQAYHGARRQCWMIFRIARANSCFCLFCFFFGSSFFWSCFFPFLVLFQPCRAMADMNGVCDSYGFPVWGAALADTLKPSPFHRLHCQLCPCILLQSLARPA